MHLFVIGGTGFVGSRLVRALVQRGHKVSALARSLGRAEHLSNMGVEVVLGDLSRLDPHAALLHGVDGIINTAFAHSEDWFEAVEQERKAIWSIIEMVEFRNKFLIATTGTGVLGDTGAVSVSDDFDGQEDFPGRVRMAVEGDLLAASHQGRVRGVVIRPPLLVHGYGSSQFVPLLVQAARETGIAGYLNDGANMLSSVHVDDLVDLYILAAESGVYGKIYNAVGDAIASRRLAEAIANGNPGTVVKPFDIEEASAVWGQFPALLLAMNNFPRGDRARDELGWKPYTNSTSLINDVETGSYSSASFAGKMTE